MKLKTWAETGNRLPNGVRIPNVQGLNDAIADGNISFAILLNGALVSRKTITRNGKKYHVTNHIDGTKQTLTEEQLVEGNYTNVGKAMKCGALIVYA